MGEGFGAEAGNRRRVATALACCDPAAAAVAGCGAIPIGGGGGNSGGGGPSSSTVGNPESAASMSADASANPPGGGGGGGNGPASNTNGPARLDPMAEATVVLDESECSSPLAPPPAPASSSRISAIVSSFVRAGTPIANGGTPASFAAALSLKAGSFSSSALRAELLLLPRSPADDGRATAPRRCAVVCRCPAASPSPPPPAAAAAAFAFCSFRQAISWNMSIPGGGFAGAGGPGPRRLSFASISSAAFSSSMPSSRSWQAWTSSSWTAVVSESQGPMSIWRADATAIRSTGVDLSSRGQFGSYVGGPRASPPLPPPLPPAASASNRSRVLRFQAISSIIDKPGGGFGMLILGLFAIPLGGLFWAPRPAATSSSPARTEAIAFAASLAPLLPPPPFDVASAGSSAPVNRAIRAPLSPTSDRPRFLHSRFSS